MQGSRKAKSALGWFLALGGLTLSGCASEPTRDPAFASVRPAATRALPSTDGSIFRAGRNLVLFEDASARRVGDILTIRLVESTDASKSADTDIAKDTSSTVTNPTIFGTSPQFGVPGILPLASRSNLNLATSLNSSNDFSADTQSTQSNRLTGEISVTVAEVLPNGNLVVQGEKLLTLNQGHEHMRISGVVRRADINPDNTIDSTRVANARIVYGGEGALAAANKVGWLARFFVSALTPF
ncbi:MAG: flagellar basal body L-ring protein FlgH [Gammaproteobacteria bacterium]|nr:flagellar basal body L-ring protein FlgH [Gammaproteobacteria bacterium]